MALRLNDTAAARRWAGLGDLPGEFDPQLTLVRGLAFMQDGLFFEARREFVLARDAGVPLIPSLWGADRCWILNSWDRYLIPKPFAGIALYWGYPIWVPPEADGEDLEAYRRLFEDSLNRGTRWCDEQFGPERPWRRVKEAGVPEIGPL